MGAGRPERKKKPPANALMCGTAALGCANQPCTAEGGCATLHKRTEPERIGGDWPPEFVRGFVFPPIERNARRRVFAFAGEERRCLGLVWQKKNWTPRFYLIYPPPRKLQYLCGKISKILRCGGVKAARKLAQKGCFRQCSEVAGGNEAGASKEYRVREYRVRSSEWTVRSRAESAECRAERAEH